jgi:hypothetical protein
VVTWLESEPDRTAKELFARLREERPGAFTAVKSEHCSDESRNGARWLLVVSCLQNPSPALVITLRSHRRRRERRLGNESRTG